jgi:hypothetical protein
MARLGAALRLRGGWVRGPHTYDGCSDVKIVQPNLFLFLHSQVPAT